MTKLNGKRERKQSNEDAGIFEIDTHNLDREWMDQPKLFFQYSVKLADARLDLEEEKAALDVVRAELDRSIRENPDDYNLSATTEAAVKNAIPEQKEYQLQQTKINDAKHRVDVLTAYVTALEHRKRALEKLVDLHGQKYFAVPRAGDDAREAVDEMEKQHTRRRSHRQRE